MNADISRCVSFLGAIDALCRSNTIELHRLNRIAGVGAGAVMAVVACRYASDPSRLCETVADIFKGKDAEGLSRKAVLSRQLSKVSCCFGLADGESGVGFDILWLMKRIGWSSDTTFHDIYKHTRCHLRLVAVNLATHSTAYLDYIFTPNMPIMQALRMCLCDPFSEAPVVYDGHEFTSTWSVPCVRKVFEEYTDEYVMLSVMSSNRISRIHEYAHNTTQAPRDVKRRSIDAVVDASRTNAGARRSFDRQSTCVSNNTFYICNICPSLTPDTTTMYDWLYNAGFNAVAGNPTIM